MKRYSLRGVGIGILALAATSVCFAQENWGKSIVSMDFETTSMHTMMNTIVSNPSVSQIRLEDSSSSISHPIIILYIGKDKLKRYPIGIKAASSGTPDIPKKEVPAQVIASSTEDMTSKVHIYNVPLDQAMTQMFAALKISSSVHENSGVVELRDTEIENELAMFDKDISAEIKGPMTCSQVQDLLREHYGWSDGWSPLSKRSRDIYCRCDVDKVIVSGDERSITVASLITALLENWARTCSPFASSPQAFHVKVGGVDAKGMRQWNILGY